MAHTVQSVTDNTRKYFTLQFSLTIGHFTSVHVVIHTMLLVTPKAKDQFKTVAIEVIKNVEIPCF